MVAKKVGLRLGVGDRMGSKRVARRKMKIDKPSAAMLVTEKATVLKAITSSATTVARSAIRRCAVPGRCAMPAAEMVQ